MNASSVCFSCRSFVSGNPHSLAPHLRPQLSFGMNGSVRERICASAGRSIFDEHRGLWAGTRLDAVARECVSRQWYDAVLSKGVKCQAQRHSCFFLENCSAVRSICSGEKDQTPALW